MTFKIKALFYNKQKGIIIMFNFDMNINHNSALFRDNNNKKIIIVDSFDNKLFDVRFGTMSKSEKIAQIKAETTEDLNKQLTELAATL